MSEKRYDPHSGGAAGSIGTIGSTAVWGGITGTLANQTDLQTALDAKVDENAAITGATKTKVTYDAKGLVTSGADATTADIADSSNKRYVTDANLTVIGNTSGVNTGDSASLPIGGGTLTGALVLATGSTTVAPIKFIAGASLTTPVAGVIEFDGTDYFITV